MLSSIHPLGERGRNSSYLLTVGAYVLGSVAGGLLTGVALGGLGSMVADILPTGQVLAAIVLLLVVTGVALDTRLFGLSVPSYHRQVNEEWLNRYRGWVYGGGFGFQLGLGFVTVVPTAGIYATFVLAVLSGSVITGALMGLTFGLVRSVMIFLMARVDSPDQLRDAHRRLTRTSHWAHRAVVGAQGAMALVMIGVLLWP